MKPEPFPLSPELRQQAIAAVGRLLESEAPTVALMAVELMLEMDRQNLEATRPAMWPGLTSKN
ncbi:MAG: hypothetical protein SH850_08025 [Planctomycetaceae bacterium]|nr:hypothetical protein [Planctomycetaceae bacterium]